jgi:hypothetical protein
MFFPEVPGENSWFSVERSLSSFHISVMSPQQESNTRSQKWKALALTNACVWWRLYNHGFNLNTNPLIPSTISYIESHAKNPLIYPWLYTYVFLFQIPKIFMVLLLSVNLAHLVCSASCIKISSNIHAPGKLFPEQRNLTCNDTCFPVFVEVTYAIIVKKPLVIACRKNKSVSGIAGYEIPLFPLSTQPVIKCKSTHKPRIVKPVSVAVEETKPGTLKARMLPIVVDCVLRSK